MLARPPDHDRPLVRCGRLVVEPRGAFARLGDDELELTYGQRLILACLAARAGKAWTRPALYAAAFGRSLPRRSRAVDQHVAEIRRALGDARGALVSIDRVGYRLDPGPLGGDAAR